MSKISKFIICCIAVIISIVSLCVPTYCADMSSIFYNIEITDSVPYYPNYYNTSNVSYVKLKNFKFSRLSGLRCFLSFNINSFINYSDGQIIEDNYSFDIQGQTISVISSYKIVKYSDYVDIVLLTWNVDGLDDFVVDYTIGTTSVIFSFHWIPMEFLSLDLGQCGCYNNFYIDYDIEYNNQYFYNNIFQFVCNSSFTTGINEYIDIIYPYQVFKNISLTDNYNNVYTARFDYNEEIYSSRYLKFINNGLSDIYITHVSYCDNIGNFTTTSLNRPYIFYYNFTCKYYDGNIDGSVNLYSGNSNGTDGNVGSLIPNGSNQFYKSAEWWDIPSHLYNFLIYLIFDAPIISNFTNLVVVLINFIVEVFEFFIGLFAGINNIFFISIFLGIIVLIFLLKIIFKG